MFPFNFNFPIQHVHIKANKGDTRFKLVPECSWFLFLGKSDEIVQFLNLSASNIPRIGKYIIILQEEEDSINLVLMDKFFDKINTVVEYKWKRSKLYGVYIRNGSEVEFYNYWNGTGYLLDKPLVPDTPLHFGGKIMRVTTVNVPPFSYKDKTNKFAGSETKLINALADSLRFTPSISTPPNGEMWGELMADGLTFNGLVGQLQKQESDIGYADLFVNLDRMKYISYTEFYEFEYVCFLYKIPPPPAQWIAIIYPLDSLTWFSFIVMSLCMCFLLYFFTNIHHQDPPIDLLSGFFLVFENSLEKSQDRLFLLKSTGSRILVVFWLLGLLVIVCGYKSGLTSVMTTQLKPKIINTIREVAQQSLPVSSFGNTFVGLANQSLDPSLQKIAENYISHYNFEEAFKNVSENKVIMAEGQTNLIYNKRKDFTDKFGKSSLHIMRECLFPFAIALGLQKDSPYNQRLSTKIRQLKESGLIQYWRKIEFDKVGKSTIVNAKQQFSTQGLQQFQVPFLLYGLMIPLAIVSFMVEKIVYK
ncbi:ionotropic receptor 21a, partial [Eurytemora carolleeae]|uniref:ionotropic receptor 21a n=1 Tax=Eurytemora carolleeae TaxID=1294199 RepID=UPI000C78033D